MAAWTPRRDLIHRVLLDKEPGGGRWRSGAATLKPSCRSWCSVERLHPWATRLVGSTGPDHAEGL
ncbi:MAG: hypothetical protein ACLUNQ_04305 [Oscillospiraceae bacterium]